jgi:hypothetical protein
MIRGLLGGITDRLFVDEGNDSFAMLETITIHGVCVF